MANQEFWAVRDAGGVFQRKVEVPQGEGAIIYLAPGETKVQISADQVTMDYDANNIPIFTLTGV